MTALRLPICAAVLMVMAIPSGSAQEQAPRAGTIVQGVRAVLVDVVVRDRKGQPVRDLTAADFEVLEDGVTQKVGSFTPFLANATATAAPPAAAPAGATDPAASAAAAVNNGPIVTALVFDRLSPEAQRLAVQAAQGYLGNKEETASYIGIFAVDLALTPYAPFTRNAQILRQALNKMSSRPTTGYNSTERQTRSASVARPASMTPNPVATAPAAGPGAAASGNSSGAEAKLAEMQSSMVAGFDAMERDQQGYSTTNGLFSIIAALGRLPGRKSLVLFSEGVAIPDAVQRLFYGVIDSANRANVSIYTMDSAGLRSDSDQARTRDMVNQAGAVGLGSGYSTDGGGGALTRGLENNSEALRSDAHSSLGQLAQETGGLLFENANNLKQGFARIEDDLRNYYLLGYSPTNDVYDGRFRKIEVKVKRSGVTVAARRGYFAVRDPGGAPVNAWEAPALGAMEQKPLPNAFPVRAGAMRFPEGDRPGLVPVVVEFKTAPLTFQPAADGKTYTSDFAVLVRFIDKDNQVARKVSQHYEVNGPIAGLDKAKTGEVIFYREPDLPVGVYTMETVVHDAPSGKSSVRLSTVEVGREDLTKLRMSSLVIVKRGEKVPEKERRAENPLLIRDVVVFPNLGDPVSKSAKEVGFYFAAYTVKGAPAPESALDLVQNGKSVALVPLPLSSADSNGRIQQLGRLPIANLPAGTYELRAIVKQGSEQISRSTMVRIVD